jgi:hypothetical protein
LCSIITYTLMASKNSKTEKPQTQVPAASANTQQVVPVKQN